MVLIPPGGPELWQVSPLISTACSCVTPPCLWKEASSRKKPLDTVTVLESGRRVTIQIVTTPTASPVSCIPSSWSVVLLGAKFTMEIYFHEITPCSIFALVLQRPINASNAVTLAHQVRTYTLEAAGFTDSVDVLYVAQMMEKFMEYVRQLREVRKKQCVFVCFTFSSDIYLPLLL